MTTGKVTITAPNGMHARPAGELVKLIRGLAPARITLRTAAREASAVSILSLLALGLKHGTEVEVCVEISSMEHFRAYDASPIPWKYIMAYIRLAVNPDLQPVYDLLHAEGVMTMTSITGSSDKVKNPYDRRVAYLRELVAEPDIIETDYPSEFIGLPWSRDAIHALQEAAMRSHRTNLK